MTGGARRRCLICKELVPLDRLLCYSCAKPRRGQQLGKEPEEVSQTSKT